MRRFQLVLFWAGAFFLFSGLEARADIYKYISDEGTVCFTNTPVGKQNEKIVKDKKPTAQQTVERRSPAVKKEAFHNVAEEKARQHNVDPKLVKAVIKAESNWNPKAVSSKGAMGLMQLMPSTAYDMGVSNPFDPEQNIDGGVRYLSYLLDRFNGNLTLALAAYNAGPKRVEQTNSVPSIPETVQYVKRVMNDYTGGTGYEPGSYPGSGGKVLRIKKVVLEDGSILFTNSYFASSNPIR